MTRVTITIDTEYETRWFQRTSNPSNKDGDPGEGTGGEDENGDIKPPGGSIPDSTKSI